MQYTLSVINFMCNIFMRNKIMCNVCGTFKELLKTQNNLNNINLVNKINIGKVSDRIN